MSDIKIKFNCLMKIRMKTTFLSLNSGFISGTECLGKHVLSFHFWCDLEIDISNSFVDGKGATWIFAEKLDRTFYRKVTCDFCHTVFDSWKHGIYRSKTDYFFKSETVKYQASPFSEIIRIILYGLKAWNIQSFFIQWTKKVCSKYQASPSHYKFKNHKNLTNLNSVL